MNAWDDKSNDLDAVDENRAANHAQHCWRCDLSMSSDAVTCPHCGAGAAHEELTNSESVRKVDDRRSIASRMKVLLVSYAMMLLLGVVHGWIGELRFSDADFNDPQVVRSALIQYVFVDAIFTTISVVALVLAGGLPKRPPPSRGSVAVAWAAALPLLTALVGANFLYHRLVSDYIDSPFLAEDLFEELSVFSVATICVQPAIVEELFFRGLALPLLATVMRLPAAVFIVAIMFGLCHVAVILSVPYLIVAGLVFGLAAAATGKLWLPVLLHFAHNLVILLCSSL